MEVKVSKKGICLRAKATFIGEDLLLVVYGGKAHIGSCLLANQNFSKHANFPRHKDHLAFEVLKKELVKHYHDNFAIIGGIHIDNISEKQIKLVLKLAKKLGKKLGKKSFLNIF